MNFGTLEVITGPMFSGKSAELVRRVELANIAKLRTTVFRPRLDTRSTEPVVLSRSGAQIQANCVKDSIDIYAMSEQCNVVGIDEAQFFAKDLPGYVRLLQERGSRVIVAGLDLDFTGEPFGPMPALLAMADSVDKMTAICMVCYSFYATRTQRLVDGEPAQANSPQVVIDKFDKYTSIGNHKTTYEARCSDCYIPPTMRRAETLFPIYDGWLCSGLCDYPIGPHGRYCRIAGKDDYHVRELVCPYADCERCDNLVKEAHDLA